MSNNTESKPVVDDPMVSHSLWEAKWILLVWLIAFLWTVGYCGLFGYRNEDQTLKTVLGMPAWVFWGVGLPWLLATAVSSWFALVCIADVPLGDDVNSEQQGDE